MLWKKIIKYTGITLLIMFALIGLTVTTVIIHFTQNPDFYLNNKFILEKAYDLTGFAYTNFGKDNSDELRQIAVNFTSNCYARNITLNNQSLISYCDEGFCTRTYCSAKSIYEHLRDSRYIATSKFKIVQDPLETYEQGGDCKSNSILVVGLLDNLGIESRVDCNVEKEHCIAIVYSEELPNIKYVVDIAQKKFAYMTINENPWEKLYSKVDGNVTKNEPVFLRIYDFYGSMLSNASLSSELTMV